MLPENLYLADKLIFQFCGLTQFNYIYIHLYIEIWGHRIPWGFLATFYQ